MRLKTDAPGAGRILNEVISYTETRNECSFFSLPAHVYFLLLLRTKTWNLCCQCPLPVTFKKWNSDLKRKARLMLVIDNNHSLIVFSPQCLVQDLLIIWILLHTCRILCSCPLRCEKCMYFTLKKEYLNTPYKLTLSWWLRWRADDFFCKIRNKPIMAWFKRSLSLSAD